MLSAGETSGDLHGAALARELRALDPSIALIGFGGAEMAAAGVTLRQNYTDYNVMGISAVLLNLRRIFALLDDLTRLMEEERPDVLVIIDYPDFNWRLAARAKERGIPVFSYIPPSAWAWRKGRAKSCAALADEIVAIFPHELPPYEAAGANISFVGNPLIDTVRAEMEPEEACRHFGIEENDVPILLMPGSRREEIERLLPPMLGAAEILQTRDPARRFFLPVAGGVDEQRIEEHLAASPVKVTLTHDARYALMKAARAAIAASGTVVMEAAVMGLLPAEYSAWRDVRDRAFAGSSTAGAHRRGDGTDHCGRRSTLLRNGASCTRGGDAGRTPCGTSCCGKDYRAGQTCIIYPFQWESYEEL